MCAPVTKIRLVELQLINYREHGYRFDMDQQGWRWAVVHRLEQQLQTAHLDFSIHYTCTLPTVK